jgi:hypothetical protein
MLERIRHVPGATLDRATYQREFRANWAQVEDFLWTLERAQSFREPGDDAWEPWIQGRWDEALAVMESRRPALIKAAQEDDDLGIEPRRIRVVGLPVTPCLQWELHSLKVRAECREYVRVLDPAELGDLEADEPLPELTILGSKVLYEVLYDDTAALAGGRRITDTLVIRACRARMAQLWEQAEDLLPFFEREIAPLPPPVAVHS